MTRVETVARALYDLHCYAPDNGWDTTHGKSRRGLYMADARCALKADDDTFAACRVCGAPTRIVADLGSIPLANSFTRDAPRFPVRVEVCDDCVLAQLEETVDPSIMFCEYPYRSSLSSTFVAAAKTLVEAQDVTENDFVVEIGSNDGYLLRHYQCRILGVDPSDVPADVPTRREFFTEHLAEQIRASHGPARVMHANNVIAHCPDPHTIMAGIKTLLDPDGVAYVESPHVDGLAWDTLYHEHVFYWSATAMCRLADKHGLAVVDAERLDVHGGSVRYHLRHRGVPTEAVLDLIGRESSVRWTLDRDMTLDCERLRRIVDRARRAGKRVCGYGAAAKGAVLLAVSGVDVDFVCDTTPGKQGQVMPGTDIPIVDESHLGYADVAVLFAWNFHDEIVNRVEFDGEWVMPHG